ncbi:MAG: hypothetical protein K0R83_2994 [Caulobacter sp.]|nr:hypothetical protein [Caulobacter sp.]
MQGAWLEVTLWSSSGTMTTLAGSARVDLKASFRAPIRLQEFSRMSPICTAITCSRAVLKAPVRPSCEAAGTAAAAFKPASTLENSGSAPTGLETSRQKMVLRLCDGSLMRRLLPAGGGLRDSRPGW